MTKTQMNKRREIKSKISVLEKNNEEMFKIWVYRKNTIDDNSLREIARKNLVEIENLKKEYEAVIHTKTELSYFSQI